MKIRFFIAYFFLLLHLTFMFVIGDYLNPYRLVIMAIWIWFIFDESKKHLEFRRGEGFQNGSKWWLYAMPNCYLCYEPKSAQYYLRLRYKVYGRSGFATLYRGKTKPRFRNLFVVNQLGMLLQGVWWIIALVSGILAVVGWLIHFIGRIFKAIGFLLLWSPHSAADEFRDLQIWYSPKDVL